VVFQAITIIFKKEQHHAENIIDKPYEKMDLGNFIRKKLGLKQ
jgi:hypothetical protein